VRYAATIGSTNDAARDWLAADAPDLALIAADEQTAGRGQAGRTWQSPAGASISFSLIVRHNLQSTPAYISRLTALGTLAVCDALAELDLVPQIKWPNDVLLAGRKVAGVLAEATWSGESLQGVVLGIGVNVQAAAVAQAMARESALRFPAVSVEEIAGHSVDRWNLMAGILRSLITRRGHLDQPVFMEAWEKALAFSGDSIQLIMQSSDKTAPVIYEGILEGLATDGALRLRMPAGGIRTFYAGEVRLLPPVTSSALSAPADL
jgi:BirA family biotin operon repressor/biotin-[acetyl-CoA-carboxylase] ligase